MFWKVALILCIQCILVYTSEELNGIELGLDQPYQGSVQVKFYSDGEEFYTTIETEDLYLRSVSWDDFLDYVLLFQDQEVMDQHKEGKIWSEEKITQAMRKWTWRWEEGFDPFSALSIFKKEEEQRVFVGYIALDHGNVVGEAELDFVIKKEFWPLNYAKQAVSSILQDYATFLHKLNFYVNLNDSLILAAPLKAIYTSARVDDSFTTDLLENMGMVHWDEEILNRVYLNKFRVALKTLKRLESQKYAEECIDLDFDIEETEALTT